MVPHLTAQAENEFALADLRATVAAVAKAQREVDAVTAKSQVAIDASRELLARVDHVLTRKLELHAAPRLAITDT